MKILVVGYLVPDELMTDLCRTDRMPPMQTHRFMKGFVEALDLTSTSSIDILSALPTNDYPQGPRIWVGFRRWSRLRKGAWWGIPFLNIFPLKHVTRFCSTLALTLGWCLFNLGKKKAIIVVSAATPQLTAAWIVARICRTKLIACLMDPPSVAMDTDTGLKRAVRRLDRWLARQVLSRADGVIAVTRPLGDKFVPNRPLKVFEGTAPRVPAIVKANRSESRFICAYAGALGESYGLPMLLEGFQYLNSADYVLWVFGRGEGQALVEEAASRSTNIVYFGYLTEGLDEKLAQSDLLLMVRPSEGEDSEFVFPSKILYSMSLGVPTAVTPLKAIPEEYFSSLFNLNDASAEALAASIEAIRAIPEEQRLERARVMKQFVEEQKSPLAVSSSLHQFLSGVVDGVKMPERMAG